MCLVSFQASVISLFHEMFISNPWKGRRTAMKNPWIYCTFWSKDASCLLLSLGCLQSPAEMCEFSFSLGSCRDLEMKKVEFRSCVSQARYIRNSSHKAGTLFVNQVSTGRPMPRYSQRLPGTENCNYHLLSSSPNKYPYNSDSSVSKHS